MERQPGEQGTGGDPSEDAGEGVLTEEAASGDAEGDAGDSTGIVVSRGRTAAGVSGEEEVEFQVCTCTWYFSPCHISQYSNV